MNTICFIGAGKMASAIAGGLFKNKADFRIQAYDPVKSAADSFSACCHGVMKNTAVEAVSDADVVLIAVKPQYLKEAVAPVSGKLDGKLVLSIVVGVTIESLQNLLGTGRIIRIMPNTPALVGEGMSCLAAGPDASRGDMELGLGIFRAVGKAFEVPEKHLDAVAGLSGSSPAYVLEFINALADGGVYAGLPRTQALELAVQTVYGTAKLAAESGLHPSQLRDNVISPGGTTARGIMALAEGAFSATVSKAVIRSAEYSAELGAMAKKG